MLYPIDDYVGDLMLQGWRIKKDRAEDYRADGITHLALLPGAGPAGEQMLFEGQSFALGFMAYYCAGHNKYRFFHCSKCAELAWHWLETMQGEWHACSGLQEEGPADH